MEEFLVIFQINHNFNHQYSYRRGVHSSELKRKGRNGAVKSVQLSWTGQYKKYVQHDFKCTSDYSDILWAAVLQHFPDLSILIYLIKFDQGKTFGNAQTPSISMR